MVVGGWRLSSILTLQTGPYETPYFPNGQGDPSGHRLGTERQRQPAGSYRRRPPQPASLIRLPAQASIPGGKNRFNWTNAAAFTCPGDPTGFRGNACATGNSGATVTNAARNNNLHSIAN